MALSHFLSLSFPTYKMSFPKALRTSEKHGPSIWRSLWVLSSWLCSRAVHGAALTDDTLPMLGFATRDGVDSWL